MGDRWLGSWLKITYGRGSSQQGIPHDRIPRIHRYRFRYPIPGGVVHGGAVHGART